MTMKPIAVALLIIALVAGCGGEHQTESANATDRAFITNMVPHHQSAVEMARIAQRRAPHPEVKALAASIIRDQQSEIELMRGVQKDIAANEHGSMDEMGTGHGEMDTSGGMDMSMEDMGMDMDPADLET